MSQAPHDPTMMLDAINQWMAGCTSQPMDVEAAAPKSEVVPDVATRELIDLRVLMCSATAAVRNHAARNGCEVRLDLPADPLMVSANLTHLELALTNLLRHAIYSNSTSVRLLGNVSDDSVAIRVDDDGCHYVPVITDIEDEHLAAVVRWSAELLGAEARSIIEEHGGQLNMTALPGRGATASFTLPRNIEGTASL